MLVNPVDTSSTPIGVFDSGAGGLSVVAAIRAALPTQAIVYFADTAFAPYGARSDREILERTQLCCSRLLDRGVAALVIACNTATANAIDELRAWAPVPVVGVEPGLKPAAAVTRNGVVGVLATRATLSSRRYRELLHKVSSQAPQVRFVDHAAHGWVELVESGELDSVHTRTLVRQAVQALLDEGADTLVLGCTHYPFLRRAIEAVAGTASLIETGPAVARELQRRLPRPPAPSSATDGDLLQFESSGDREQFAALAAILLAVADGGKRSHTERGVQRQR
ncbi:Glutamate racemase [Burkholderiales bacterium]|nr:Glutamate racemase [Burkholderiales bacterium]